jgi:hypothetical protein
VTECTGQRVLFSIGKRRVTAVFDGGNLTSDSGVLFLNRIDERLELSRRRDIGVSHALRYYHARHPARLAEAHNHET